jgi:hypothetical protein
LSLLGIFVLAAYFRFYRLNQLPPGFTFDEAAHAMDALDILRGRFIFLSSYLVEVPATYMYLVAGAFNLFGPIPLAQRAVTAAAGLLLLPVNFWAALALFGRESRLKALGVAGFSTLLLASSFWAVLTSRIGYEYILVPLFGLPAITLFWLGCTRQNWKFHLAAAILTPVGFYFYRAAAAFLPVIPVAVIVYKLLPSRLPTPRWQHVLLFAAVVGLLSLPLLLVLTTGPQPPAHLSLEKTIFYRANSLPELGSILGRSLLAHTQTFLAVKGDTGGESNLPGRPLLDPILAASLAAGLVISFSRAGQLPYLLLLVYWAAMLAPSILTFFDTPYHFRMSGAIPATYIFIALAWTELCIRLTQWLNAPRCPPTIRRIAPTLALTPFLLVGLVWQPLQTYRAYFITWAANPTVQLFHDTPVVALVQRMAQETDPHSIFILPRDPANPRPNHSIDFLYHGSAPFQYLPVNEDTLNQALTNMARGHRTVHLISRLLGGRETAQQYADPHHRLSRLLDRYSTFVSVEQTDFYTIQTYTLESDHVKFETGHRPNLPASYHPLAVAVGNQLELAGYAVETAANTLQVHLAWRGLAGAAQDYTVFVQVVDPQGRRAAGIDLRPHRNFTTLPAGEIMLTHYAIPLPANLPPAAYRLRVGLYYFAGNDRIELGAAPLPTTIALPR